VTFARPTHAQIISRTADDLGPAASLRRSVERALARSIAGESHSLHGHLSWASRQAIPTTADDESLVEWASLFQIDRKQPTQGTGTATFTGTNGTEIPAGTVVYLSDADGTRYTVDALVTVASGTATVAITSEEYAESVNCDAGAVIRLASPISGIDTEGEVDADIEDGTDLEEIEDLRDRLILRMQSPPRGGSEADYETWAKATPGVDVGSATVIKGYSGDGTIGLVITIDDDNPIPSGGQVTLVQDYVEPLTPAVLREFVVVAAVAQDVTYDIQIAPYPSPAVEAAILASLAELHARDCVPGGTLLVSHIREAISAATGETDHVLVAPTTNQTATSEIHLRTYNASLVTFGAIP
jgi:uncharacterized phage protein gp47/JayE